MVYWTFSLPSDLDTGFSLPCAVLSIASGSAYIYLPDLKSKILQRH